MKPLAGLLSGIIFGFGLALSGMSDRDKVLGFLDIFGDWQPALLLVMAAAVTVTLLGFAVVRRQRKPLFAPSFYLPTARAVDAKLLGGAALFGMGWGVYGFCPGPAFTALFYGDTDTYYFVLAMITGMWIASRLETRTSHG
ncbi:gene II and x protein [gamma proteobacterium NOR5-3]|nr:gene II and x protein [gamma proteobacterium NOR5-3]